MNAGIKAVFFKGVEIDSLRRAISAVRDAGARSLMILACESDPWNAQDIEPLLRSLDLPVFGGVFPSIIHEAKLCRSGTLVVGFPLTLDIAVVTKLKDKAGIEPQMQRLASTLSDCRSLFVLVDGLSTNLETFVESLYGVVGVRASITGGGAGHLDLVQRPCLLSNQGLLVDSALLVALPMSVDRGLAHGWQMLSGPFLVTRSRGNVLEELNYRPAFEIYREEAEKHSELHFAETEFFSISKTYPLGIESIDGEYLVRDPIKRSGNALICVGDVPENATVYLLKGDADALIAAAGEAAKSARVMRQKRLAKKPVQPHVAMVFDCISRRLFLDEGFADELEAIEKELPEHDCIVGALTIGEIASSHRGVIELMNKSILVALT